MTDPNYKALCAELADALLCWQTDGAWIDQAEQSRLIARARAALDAQPEPEDLTGPALEDLRIIELLLKEHKSVACTFYIRRALEALPNNNPALAQPEPGAPTDEELLRMAASAIDPCESSGIAIGEYEPETELEVYGSELIAYARAVLARWGTPANQPVPVSERLPGSEDCTAQGWCWVLYRGFATWTLEPPLGQDGKHTGYTHWLPHWALPVPAPANTINQEDYDRG